MFVEYSRRRGQLRQELNVRLDDFDTGKRFTPDGVRMSPPLSLQTFNHYVVAPPAEEIDSRSIKQLCKLYL